MPSSQAPLCGKSFFTQRGLKKKTFVFNSIIWFHVAALVTYVQMLQTVCEFAEKSCSFGSLRGQKFRVKSIQLNFQLKHSIN